MDIGMDTDGMATGMAMVAVGMATMVANHTHTNVNIVQLQSKSAIPYMIPHMKPCAKPSTSQCVHLCQQLNIVLNTMMCAMMYLKKYAHQPHKPSLTNNAQLMLNRPAQLRFTPSLTLLYTKSAKISIIRS